MDDAAAATRVAVLRLLQQQEAEDGEPSEDPPGARNQLLLPQPLPSAASYLACLLHAPVANPPPPGP